MQNSNESF